MVDRMVGARIDPKDALQEIMIKLWVHRKKLETHPNPDGFAFLTARNYCLDQLRRKKVRPVDADDHLGLEATHTGHEDFELKELIQVIEKILEDAPEQQREVLLMRDIDGLEYHEIAAALQLNVQHVRVIISRSRKLVSGQLKKNYSYEK